MCGICGEISLKASVEGAVSQSRVESMMACLALRGPDDQGVWQANPGGHEVCLGHRRLKVIDLSQASAQPMVDQTLGLAIVFNGCIYNYRELRQILEKKGYTFFSDGDTEVILKAYHAWGQGCVKRLNGMFAFVVVDQQSGDIFIARDRLGIKPFYYAQVDGVFRFASTLPALLKTPRVDQSLDPVALNYYMSFHAIVPAPNTILNGVKKLPPATVMMLTPDGQGGYRQRQKEYWRPMYGVTPDTQNYGKQDWAEHLLVHLRHAVKRRQVADVPVGCLLSGGLDSSLLVGLLAEAGQQNLHTFSIGFERVDEEPGDEFVYSDLMANHFGTTHHQIQVDSSRTLLNLDQCIESMSEPMVSHDCIGFYLLGEEVSQHLKVVQSGQGADEIFAGYHWYPPLLKLEDGFDSYRASFFDRDYGEYVNAMQGQWVGADHASRFVRQHFDREGADCGIDQALRIDSTVMLADDPVKRVDNMTMAWGLEARVPFLDHELVEFAAQIPGQFKTQPIKRWRKTGGKQVLKDAARGVIPEEVIDRPKGYFPVPALRYLRGDYLKMVQETLNTKAALERGVFNQSFVNQLLREPESHLTPLRGSMLWQVALLEKWLQSQGI